MTESYVHRRWYEAYVDTGPTLCREALRDRRAEEYDASEYPARSDRRWEIEPECENE